MPDTYFCPFCAREQPAKELTDEGIILDCADCNWLEHEVKIVLIPRKP